ncbi:MAG: alpha-L-rhamnosidase C-terminal domain-containing protein [Candidatus Solibacter sp.]
MIEWAVVQLPIEGNPPRPFEYPWEGNPWDEAEDRNNDLTSSPGALALLVLGELAKFPKDLRSKFQPARKLVPGVMEQVTNQIFYAPPGGFTDPAIRAGQPRRQSTQALRMLSAASPARRTSGIPSEEEAPGGVVAIGSPFFLFFSLEALFQRNMPEIALNVIRRDWGAMSASGTRTCWETFKHDERHWTRSVCHAWSAAPAVYLPSRVLGIRPVEPGYRKLVIAPCTADLQWARGSVATPYGPIFASWRRDASGEIQISYSAPDQCHRVEITGHL